MCSFLIDILVEKLWLWQHVSIRKTKDNRYSGLKASTKKSFNNIILGILFGEKGPFELLTYFYLEMNPIRFKEDRNNNANATFRIYLCYE